MVGSSRQRRPKHHRLRAGSAAEARWRRPASAILWRSLGALRPGAGAGGTAAQSAPAAGDSAPTRVQGGALPKAAPAKPTGGEQREAAPTQSSGGQFTSLYASEAARQRRLLNGETDEDLNRAAEKRAFLTDREPQARAANTLAGGREAPLSPYEVKAGTVIPAIMVGGVSSDLPGQLIGQVAENVYDTATGRYILIPQGSKLVGTYDNAVTTGQSRVLVAWTRIIYPDASSIDLGKMPGADQSGFAGFKDKVDNHFWEMFGSALLMSVFSAGVQISQGGGNSGNDGQSAQQTIAAGLGQQLGQLGQELARRNARIQPTLEIRPGYRFTVMVTKDMVVRPWRRTGEIARISTPRWRAMSVRLPDPARLTCLYPQNSGNDRIGCKPYQYLIDTGIVRRERQDGGR